MEKTSEILHFEGWHGTDEGLEASICANNFQVSEGEHHWLGSGAYFFTKGIGQPQEHARNWACSEAHKKRYGRYVVLCAGISASDDAVFDLSEPEALELFNQHRRFVLENLRQTKHRFKEKYPGYSDGKVFEQLGACIGIALFINNFYVRFGQDRIEKIESRIPNCTFLCVPNPKRCIELTGIQAVERGDTLH